MGHVPAPLGGVAGGRARLRLLISLGASVLPVIGPLIGLLFVWASTRWTTRSKVIATVLVLVLAALPVLCLFAVRFGAQPMGIVP